MQKFWKTKQFQAINKNWNSKLSESGFKDAEIEKHGEFYLKKHSHCDNRHHENVAIVRENKQAYFHILDEYIQKETDFPDESDRLIMELTAQGFHICEISETLRSLFLKKNHRNTIRFIRRRYEHKWGIKTWKPEDMVSRRVPIK
jgi:uncharacterized protein Smg (DUF494 family)